MAKTQEYDVAQQLKDGIRFFDLRLDLECTYPDLSDDLLLGHICSTDTLHLVHGPIDCGYTLDDILDMFISFLNSYPQEVIIVCVKQENEYVDSAIFTDILKKYLDKIKYANYWYKKNSLPKLSEVRKKMVLFRRFNLPAGLDKNQWGYDLSDWQCTANYKSQSAPHPTYIQDDFDCDKAGYGSIALKKAHLIKNMIEDSYADTEKKLYINFWSHSFNMGVSIKTHAAEIHSTLESLIKNNFLHSKCRGIFPMDYYQSNWIVLIINSNFIPEIKLEYATPVAGKTYQIECAGTFGYVLEIKNCSTAEGAQVHLASPICDDKNQEFILSKDSKNNWSFMSKKSNLYLGYINKDIIQTKSSENHIKWNIIQIKNASQEYIFESVSNDPADWDTAKPRMCRKDNCTDLETLLQVSTDYSASFKFILVK